MTAAAILPDTRRIGELYTNTLAKTVHVKPGQAADPANSVTATYVDDSGGIRCIIVCETTLGACLGAALMLIPATVALEEAAKGKLSITLLDTLREILNISSQLFRSITSRHRISLGKLYFAGAAVPADLKTMMSKPSGRLDVEIDIADYTSGRMSLLIIA